MCGCLPQVRGVTSANVVKLFEEFKVNEPTTHELVVCRDRGAFSSPFAMVSCVYETVLGGREGLVNAC
jgi:hypothetical protein